ncbi:hypothetical protein HPP92_019620 [Vanilla planifolia]|uniref:Uncharacterized protein n=1 Tax=Vanilla planifolia TaxID=51239 RepID=A0A835Q377_VANPL|nr:hypothetical protein HPP92_019620 [Vanilla planifolia]
MGNPSIEAAIKLEKKRTDLKLRELDQEVDSSPITGFFKRAARDRLARERERLEQAEEAFKALDLNKLRNCFGFDTFFAVDVRRFGDGGIFVGNLRKPIEEVLPKLERKLSEAAGRKWYCGSWKRRKMMLPWVINNYESLLPNKKALFDIPVARTASAYLASVALAVSAFIADGSLNGGDNAL